MSVEGRQRPLLLGLAPAATLLLLIGPVAAGLAGIVLPAFGYFPALGGNSLSLAAWRDLFAAPGLGRSVGLSFGVALASTFISFALAQLIVGAWHGTRAFFYLRHALSPLLSVPHAAAAFALAFLIAPSGWLMRLVSPWPSGFERPPDVLILHDPLALSMIAGLVLKETPFLFLMTLAALPQSDAERLTRVAMSFGYGRLAAWSHAALPQLYRQIRLPVLAVLAYSSSVVDVAVILGPTLPPPLAVRLTDWMRDPDLQVRFQASAGAILQLGVTGAVILTWLAGERLVGRLARRSAGGGRRYANDAPVRWAIAALAVACVAVMALGFAVLGLWSVAGLWSFPETWPAHWTTANWTRHLPQAASALGVTLAVGLLALAGALVLTAACLEGETRRGRRPSAAALGLIYVPLLVPQIAFLFGLQMLLIAARLDTSPAALVLAHLVFVLPYVFLSLADPWRAVDPRYGQVAAGFGASPTRVLWRIRLPLLLRPLLVAAAVGFAVTVGLYLPTLLIGGGRFATLTTEAVALASGGNRRVIAVYALLQTALPFFGFALALAVPAWLYRNRRGMETVR